MALGNATADESAFARHIALNDVVVTKGPPSIADEGGSLSGLVSVAVAGRDIRGYVEEAQRAVREHVALPAGYTLQWSGQYEHLIRAEERLKMVVPVTLGVILLLLYLNFRSMAKSLIVLLSVPFAVIGAIWFLYLLGYNLSVAVWVGIIALAGVAAETGVVMLVYLDEAYERRLREGRMATAEDLREAIIDSTVRATGPSSSVIPGAPAAGAGQFDRRGRNQAGDRPGAGPARHDRHRSRRNVRQ